MPYKYAIKVKTDKVISRDYDGDPTAYAVEYHLAPKDYADTDKNGMKMLVSAVGVPLTGWVPINRVQHDLTAIKRSSQHSAILDFAGTQLAVGDYVLTHYRKMDDLQICEVIGFVKQGKARILPVADFEQSHGILRFPRELIQLHPSVLGEDPTGEWIPTEEELI